MTDEGKAARNAYHREYRAAHKDSRRATQARYWEGVAAKMENKALKMEKGAGPLEALAQGVNKEIEKRKAVLVGITDPEKRATLEAEIRHLEDLTRRLDFPLIEIRDIANTEDNHHEDQ